MNDRFRLLTAAVLAMSCVSTQAHAADIFVTSFADDNGTGCTLREAITSANNDNAAGNGCTDGSGADALWLLPGEDYVISSSASDDANVTGDFDITSSIAVIGSAGATTIDAAGNDRIFDIQGSTAIAVEMLGLSLQNGSVQDSGGGLLISNAMATVTIEDCRFEDNTSTLDGGAGGAMSQGLQTGSSVTVRRTTFTGNSADAGGAVQVWSDAALFEDCEFSGNTATHPSFGIGGGVLAHGYGTATFRRTLFAANHAATSGGAIYSTRAPVVLESSTISSNRADVEGGGITVRDGDLDMFATTLYGNYAPTGSAIKFEMTTGAYRARSVLITHCPGTALSGVALSDFDVAENNLEAQEVSGVLGLGLNGGFTRTHALDASSPALGAGNCTPLNGEASRTDQRGNDRPVANCDIGAYERRGRLLTESTTEAAGDNCAAGGNRIDVGFDDDESDALEEDEVTETFYACSAAGASGATGLVSLTTLEAGDEICPSGGVQIDTGLDNGDGDGAAGDGTLQPGEIDDTEAVCEAAASGCSAGTAANPFSLGATLALTSWLALRRRRSSPH